MNNYFINGFMLFLALLLLKCDIRNNIISTKSDSPNKDSALNSIQHPNYFDTVIYPFVDPSTYIRYTIFNLNDPNEGNKNACLKLIRRNKSDTGIISIDSLYSMHPSIELQDFNNDKVKDVLIFYYNGGMANPSYHLYLVDIANNSLRHVKGFENLPNPEFDSTNNVITTTALAGQDVFFNFYRITNNGKLIDLKHGFKSGPDDSLKFINVFKLLKENLQ